MKRVKKLSLIAAIAAIALLIALFCALFGNTTGTTQVAHASSSSGTEFSFTSYSVTYDIRSDRTMDITLDLTAHYLGRKSTGFIYDIPVNGGDRVRNLHAYKLEDGKETHLEYTIENEDYDFISVYMDDNTRKTGETHSYRIKYEYAITKPKSKNNIYLNAIGFGSAATIENVSVVINLPDGLIKDNTRCWLGRQSTNENDYRYYDFDVKGNVVTLTCESLPKYNGITFDFKFEDGALSTKPDLTPYWIIIGACAVFALLFAIKFLCLNKNDLTPIPCFSVPVNPPDGVNGVADSVYDDPTREMDPLLMGKLIDNKVDSSDITSLLYYWANKGYIKINMENEKDIVLIRIFNTLPEGSPDYQVTMYTNLFKKGEIVHVNSLANTFYTTVDTVTKQVNKDNGKLYDGKSMAVAIIFALLGALVMGLTPIFIAMFTINTHLLIILPMFMIVPVFVVFALTQSVRYRKLKYKKRKMVLLYCAVAGLSLLFCGLYMLIVPSYVIELLPKFLLGVVGFAIVMFSVSLIVRTEDYSKKLNRILGFKDFIETVEKEKLEMMLESNPEFYYNVLPYAIVLGVSDKWEKKFEGLTIKPPQWATGHHSNTVFNVLVFNSLMHNANMNMIKTMVSRPSSSSRGGFGGHGGHIGGGHGGGGFRGK